MKYLLSILMFLGLAGVAVAHGPGGYYDYPPPRGWWDRPAPGYGFYYNPGYRYRYYGRGYGWDYYPRQPRHYRRGW